MDLGIVGTVLGSISLTICLIQAFIMARLMKRLSVLIGEETGRKLLRKDTLDEKSESIEDKEEEEEQKGEEEEKKVWSPPSDKMIPPALRMIPTTRDQQQISYSSSGSNSIDSYFSESSNEQDEGIVDVRSPTVSELKNALALPLQNILTKSHTLDLRQSRSLSDQKRPGFKELRPRAQTSTTTTITSPDKAATIARTPTEVSSPGVDSALGTPGSDGPTCKDQLAYVVTEIVDLKDTKKRPSVRLRENLPRKQLAPKIQKQLEQPDPIYFSLERSAMPDTNDIPLTERYEMSEEATSSNPIMNNDLNKNWRQVLPSPTDRLAQHTDSCDENKNTCLKPEPKEDLKPFKRSPFQERKVKTALKPPPRKRRTPAATSSDSGLQRGGTWSPRTMERHRLMTEGVVKSLKGLTDDVSSRNMTGSLREDYPRPTPTSSYEPVITQSSSSTLSRITFAEEKGGYSKLVRQADGRPRAASIDSAVMIEGSRSDRPYNQLVVG